MTGTGWGNPAPSTETIQKFLHVTGFEYCGQVWWRDDPDGNIRLFVPCNDFFAWACSDVEEVTDTNIDSLVATVGEVEEIVGKWNAHDAFLLWVARQRGTRPQGAFYKHLDQPLWHLFDVCGPEREVGLGNPHARPDGQPA